MRRFSLATWFTFLLCTASSSSSAVGAPSQHPATTMTDRVHHIVGVKMIGLGQLGEHRDDLLWGPGLIYELTLIPHWFEIELAAAALFSAERAKIPIDVLVKKPFVLNEVVDMFLGVGPVLDLNIEDGHTRAFAGVIVSAGSFFWITPQTGLLVELDYAFIAEENGLHEIEAALGYAFRFE